MYKSTYPPSLNYTVPRKVSALKGVTNGVAKGMQDAGNQAAHIAQDAGDAIAKGAQDAGAEIADGVQQFGKGIADGLKQLPEIKLPKFGWGKK